MLILRKRVCRWSKDANTNREGMPIPIERGCQYRERGDADTKSEGMPMEKGCQYQGVLYQGSRDANAIREGILMPGSAIPMEQGC
jgi:hypothetical protein